jgi:hypothetical protein
MKRLFPTAALALLAIIAAPAATVAATVFESFEDGLSPWRENAEMPRPWQVNRFEGLADHGQWSVEISQDGRSDDGTVWMVREIRLPAGTSNVGVEFSVFSQAQSDLNNFQVVAYIGQTDPQTMLEFTVVGHTGQAAGWVGGYQHSQTLNLAAPGPAYVAVGIDIVYEDIRTYLIDSVSITGIPVQCGDGQCTGGETACDCPVDCPGPGPAPGETACTDGVDDDCDGFVDCDDSECNELPVCNAQCDNDGYCEINEGCLACPGDCPDGGAAGCCGDGVCDFGDIDICMWDCEQNPCDTQSECDDGVFCNGVDFTNDVCVGCDTDGVCEPGEDCNTCAADCFSGGGGTCGNTVCETDDGESCETCSADCNGVQSGKPAKRYCCGDGITGDGAVTCSDPRCTGGGNTCTIIPAASSCCGGGTCEGSENGVNCGVDCACQTNVDCDDADLCTTDSCNGGVCENVPLDCDDADACTADSCSGGVCVNDPLDCDDADPCTADSCEPATGCVNDPIPGCSCGERNDPCSLPSDCCSGECKPNGRCR